MAGVNFRPYEAPEFGSALSDKLRDAAANMQRNVTALTANAVCTWAAACNMTPENWLDFWRPVIESKPGDEPGIIVFTVRAEARDDLPGFTVPA